MHLGVLSENIKFQGFIRYDEVKVQKKARNGDPEPTIWAPIWFAVICHSGDGTMGVFNIKRRRFELLSEYQSGDLTSVALMKRGKKVVCGSSEGTIYIFNWNGFGATSDRFALKAESIDQILPITDSIMCTASTDGYIRWVVLTLKV